MSLKQLDEHIRQTKTGTLIALNSIGEREQLEKRTRRSNLVMLLTSGLMVLIGTALDFNGMIADYIQIALSGITLIVMTWAFFQDSRRALLSMAAISTAFAVYNLIGAYYVEGQIDVSNIFIGALQILSVLYYISEANKYDMYSTIADLPDERHLYEMVYATLTTQKPNNSNTLIELKELTQTIIIWLRDDGVIMLLQGENRLYFDVHQSFTMSATSNDGGGDKLTVKAVIINQTRRCQISRHGWLRYTRFAL